ncbi:GntR family transcriptional regulator [Janibacter sp. GXQ6167]|uniref:GntR family transcriptional regulator n=1 Tax=Janibacter sp. GXQ6167 TaxID=3240791 RepID=UPI0035241688
MRNDDLAAALQQIPAAPLARPSAAEQVRRVLRTQIIDGLLRPGTRLTEETITSVLGYSRNTIREAFVLLAAERLVVREAHRGVFVATPGADDIRDIFATRRLIEPAAVEGGRAFSDHLVGRLRDVVDTALAAAERGDLPGVAQANQEFHRGLVAFSGSARAATLMEDVLAEMRLVFHAMATDPRFHLDYLQRNVQIVAMLERGERREAAAALTQYLDDAQARLLGESAGGADG